MTKQDFKKALFSLLIGAGVSFFLTLFQGIMDFITTNSKEFVSGGTAGLYYFIKNRPC